MIVKNDYHNCITNLACSIQKYFGVEYKHDTLKDIDEILARRQPKNVILLLYDGMGARIIERNLPEDSFFIRNKLRDIYTVFPATTTAATTSVQSGLNPVEHGWLGWDCYVPPIDKVITLFREREKGSNEISEEFLTVKDQYAYKSIVPQINEKGDDKAYSVSPFGDVKYESVEEMMEKISQLAHQDGRKFIYGYNSEPDSSMHDYGPDSPEVLKLIWQRNDLTEQMVKDIEDSVVIVIADHGHRVVDTIYLTDYPDVLELLERPTSVEPRAVSFKIKEGKHQLFEELFNKYFSDSFTLYTAEDVISSKLFGDGAEYRYFRQSLGDYLAIAYGDKVIRMDDSVCLYSEHAGYTDDEIYIPLIVVER